MRTNSERLALILLLISLIVIMVILHDFELTRECLKDGTRTYSSCINIGSVL